MKKLWSSVLYMLYVCSGTLYAQNSSLLGTCLYKGGVATSPAPGGRQESRNGRYLTAQGTINILMVFVEIEYDEPGFQDPFPTGGNATWPAGSLPAWKDNFMDATVLPQPIGEFSRYFYDASFGKLRVTGDYLVNPGDPGTPVKIKSSKFNGPSPIYDALIIELNNTFHTFKTGHNQTQSSFNLWKLGLVGDVKVAPAAGDPPLYDHVMFLIRNWGEKTINQITNQLEYKGLDGVGNTDKDFPYPLLGYKGDTYSIFGANSKAPMFIARHEFSHNIFGDNDMHPYGDGGQHYYNMPVPYGWSILSLGNASLKCLNAWDRYRLDWKPDGVSNRIHARNDNNTAELNGDINAAVPGQDGVYTLRDFQSTGDAIRIKLPFIPDTIYPQWLWLEYHSCTDPIDKYVYEDDPANTCISPAIAGLYAYNIVDKDNIEGPQLYAGRGNYIRVLPADGMHDYVYEVPRRIPSCVNGDSFLPFRKGLANPLSGEQDQEEPVYDADTNGVINFERYYHNIENLGGSYISNFAGNGHSRHAFTLQGNKKLGLATNPSTANMLNLSVDLNRSRIGEKKDNRTIHLNGVSVEIIEQQLEYAKIRLRFNDVEVNRDLRWCGEDIALHPIANAANGYSLNLVDAKTITLDQGTTATRPDNPQYIDGQAVFASPTKLRCLPGSKLHIQDGSLILKKNSELTIEAGAMLEMESAGRIVLEAGCTLRVQGELSNKGGILLAQEGAKIELLGNGIIKSDGGKIEVNRTAQLSIQPAATMELQNSAMLLVKTDGDLVLYGNTILHDNTFIKVEDGAYMSFGTQASMALLDDNSMLELAGRLAILPNATFKFTGNGFIRFNKPGVLDINNPNVVGAEGSIDLQGTGPGDKIMEIMQESLYLPYNLKKCSIRDGRVVMYSNARLLPDGDEVLVDNVTLTSNTGTRTQHRGLLYFGSKSNILIRNSRFENGKYGIYADGRFGSYSLKPDNCTFNNNEYGIYSYDCSVETYNSCLFTKCNTGIHTYTAGLSINNSTFQSCQYGVYGDVLQLTSSVSNSTFGLAGSTIQSNPPEQNYTGAHFSNCLGELFLSGNTFAANEIGLSADKSVLKPSCSSFYGNAWGIYMGQRNAYDQADFEMATLVMDQTLGSGGYGAHNDIHGNDIGVEFNKVFNLSLWGGNNNLINKLGNAVIRGNVITPNGACPSRLNNYYELDVSRNKWRSLCPLPIGNPDYPVYGSARDYYILSVIKNGNTYQECVPYLKLKDNDPLFAFNSNCTSGNVLTCKVCGNLPPIIIRLNCNAIITDFLALCKTCTVINTVSFINKASNEAVRTAFQTAATLSPAQAIDQFKQILTFPILAPAYDEVQVLDRAYLKTLEVLTRAFTENIFKVEENTVAFTQPVQDVLSIIEYQVNRAIQENNYLRRVYYTLDKALVYRLSGRLDKTLQTYDAMQSWLSDAGHIERVNRLKCLTELDIEVRANPIRGSEIEVLSRNCPGLHMVSEMVASGKTENRLSIEENSSIENIEAFDIIPNPSSHSAVVAVHALPECTYSIDLTDMSGRIVKHIAKDVLSEEALQQFDVDNEHLSEGIYFLRLQSGNKLLGVKKYVVVK